MGPILKWEWHVPLYIPKHRSLQLPLGMLMLMIFAVGTWAHAQGAPTLQFIKKKNWVKAQNSTPFGDVMLFSISRESDDWIATVTPRLQFKSANHNGIALAQNIVDVVDSSIWSAFDLSSGTYTVNSPGDFLEPRGLLQDQLLASPGYLTYPGQRLEVVIVRGSSVWHGKSFDSNISDGGPGSDNEVMISYSTLSQVYPLLSQTQFQQPMPGDVVIGMDAAAMTWFSLTITGTPPKGGTP